MSPAEIQRRLALPAQPSKVSNYIGSEELEFLVGVTDSDRPVLQIEILRDKGHRVPDNWFGDTQDIK